MQDCLYKVKCARAKTGQCPDTLCIKKYKLDYLFDQIPLSENKRTKQVLSTHNDIEAFGRLAQLEKTIVKEVADGKNIYIYSSHVGNGKTSWAIRLVQSYIYNIWPEAKLECKVLFINVPRYLLELKASISKPSSYIEHIRENITDVSLVIWDDIGTKSATEFEHEHLLSMIDSRVENGRSNIYTSNVCPDDLSLLLGDRLSSRIVNRSETIEFIDDDKRGGDIE